MALDLSAMQGLLVGTSALLAMRLEENSIALTDDEAGNFLKAAQNVARHYSVETTQRTLDWIAFVGVSVQVFGTRAVTVMVNSKRRKVRAVRQPGSNVIHVNGLNGGQTQQTQQPQQEAFTPSVPPGPDDFDFN